MVLLCRISGALVSVRERDMAVLSQHSRWEHTAHACHEAALLLPSHTNLHVERTRIDYLDVMWVRQSQTQRVLVGHADVFGREGKQPPASPFLPNLRYHCCCSITGTRKVRALSRGFTQHAGAVLEVVSSFRFLGTAFEAARHCCKLRCPTLHRGGAGRPGGFQGRCAVLGYVAVGVRLRLFRTVSRTRCYLMGLGFGQCSWWRQQQRRAP